MNAMKQNEDIRVHRESIALFGATIRRESG